MLKEETAGSSGGRETLLVDLNCDMGEGMETDAAIFPYISSANIACGYHAGDADTMRRTVELALKHHVAIGAHPSYPDRYNFGRIDILGTKLQLEEIPGMVVDQLILLQAVCDEFGARLHHVKPHGALYNRAAKDAMVSALICRAIREFDPSLLLYGLSDSHFKEEADRQELSFISEVFADRTYQEDGSLTPRTEPNALIEDPQKVIAQVMKMVREGKVNVFSRPDRIREGEVSNPDGAVQSANLSTLPKTTGKEIPILAETICLHGDGSHAVEFARLIHTALLEREVSIRAPF